MHRRQSQAGKRACADLRGAQRKPRAGLVRALYNRRRLFSQRLILAIAALFALAFTATRADGRLLEPEAAFKLRATEKPGEVDIHFAIADGYYMYRSAFVFAVKRGDATLGTPALPQGRIRFDANFQQEVETYRHGVILRLPIVRAGGPFELEVTSQGCADQGVCYAPRVQRVRISGIALKPLQRADLTAAAKSDETPALTADTTHRSGIHRLYQPQYAQALLEAHRPLTALPIFFLLGLGLSLLPCSLPMIPILAALIAGDRAVSAVSTPAGTVKMRLTRRRSLMLSLTYVLGMALVYTAFGVAVALIGQSLGRWLRNPYIVGAFAILLTLFALSLFGCYELQLPQRWQNRIHHIQQRQAGGRFAAVFVMGAVSALAVGVCMTAPLFGVLTFIAQGGEVIFGGAALFLMALGIGAPLLIVGAGAGAWLPHAGAWSEGIVRVLGILLLAVALWLIFPVLPKPAAMLLLAFYLLLIVSMLTLSEPFAGPPGISGASMAVSPQARAWRRVGKAIAAMLGCFAVVLVIGAAAGSDDPLRPLAVFAKRGGGVQKALSAALFKPVKTMDEFEHALRTSARPALLDFYADWCTSCREMEQFTFTDSRVRARLAQFNLLRADVTANRASDRALLKRFDLYGPPAIVFFDRNGKEMKGLRIIGYQPPDIFLSSLGHLQRQD